MTTTKPLPELTADDHRWWFRHLNGYHVYVLGMCALGWMFDCADQMIFTASRSNALHDLMQGTTPEQQAQVSGWVTSLFMIGWATGGLLFGTVGDRWGRAKTMALTVFLYAAFTGLSALVHTWQAFAVSRFVTGFGVGGEFGAGAALVADVMPAKARTQALALLQALSAVGNIIGAKMLGVISMRAHDPHMAWRYLYLFGALPALIAVFVMSWMKEPEKWIAAKAAAAVMGNQKFGRIRDLFFSDPRWRRNTLVGLALAISGVIGLWGIGFYSPELIDNTFPKMPEQTGQHLEAVLRAPDQVTRSQLVVHLSSGDTQAYRELLSRVAMRGQSFAGDLSMVQLTPAQGEKLGAQFAKRITPERSDQLKSNALVVQQIGAFFGMLSFGFLALRIGRRWTFALAFAVAWASIVIVFLEFQHASQIWYLYPFLGFCTLLPFGGYAVYFPEIFPTRLRSTGTGFCYNVGRYIAAVGPIALTSLRARLTGYFEIPAFRAAALIVSVIYVLGIVAAFLGPETKGQPLPEDQAVPAH